MKPNNMAFNKNAKKVFDAIPYYPNTTTVLEISKKTKLSHGAVQSSIGVATFLYPIAGEYNHNRKTEKFTRVDKYYKELQKCIKL